MSTVRRAETAPVSGFSMRSTWLTRAAATSALLLIVLGVRFLPDFQTPPDTGALVSHKSLDTGGAVGPVLSLVNREKLMELSRNLDKPLQAELQFVVSDAKTAIQSLAHSFIPQQMIAQSGW